MTLDHDAIRKAYPDTILIEDANGAFDKDGKSITLEQSKIDTARSELNAEYAAIKYQRDRASEYPSVVDQLDKIYHSGVNAWKADIKAIKDKYPKP